MTLLNEVEISLNKVIVLIYLLRVKRKEKGTISLPEYENN